LLIGDPGDDMFWGGAGADTFVFGKIERASVLDSGHDTVRDFEDGDIIVLRGDGDTFYGSYSGKKTFDDVNITQSGDDFVITWGKDSIVTLLDYDASALTVDDFELVPLTPADSRGLCGCFDRGRAWPVVRTAA